MNPNGLIPTIRLGDFVLWESNAILRYLNNKFGKEKFDLEKTALVDQWTDWSGDLSREMTTVYRQLIRTPEKERNMQQVKQALNKLNALWKILDNYIGEKKSKFIVGDSLTVADVATGSFLHRYYNIAIERPHYPHIEAWHKRLSERKGFKEFVQVELV